MLATFAAGCFWGVEATFANIPGVIKTEVGYTGGYTQNPTYPQVCQGNTGHAESVKIEFNPEQITYEKLLQIFWNCHNPTTLNQQGPDIGSQYRSVIFYHNEEQKIAAEKSKGSLQGSGKYTAQIVTEIVPASLFYRAEEYHQNYIKKQGIDSCHF